MKALVLSLLGASTLAMASGHGSFGAAELPALAAIQAPSDTAPASMLSQIGAYEKKFFELSFDGETTGRRLDRLETFIFGATGSGSPQARIAKIAKVVPLTTNEAPKTVIQPITKQAPPAPEPALESPGHYPHITALEAKILGETYPIEPLPERLSRLETKAFGAPSKSQDLEERTDAIDRYLQARRTPKAMTIGVPPDDDDLDAAASTMERHYDFKDDRAAASTRPRHYELAGDDPGAIVRQEAIDQELADAQKSTPPTKEERTLSRIAWCEQQVFGHASPEMHLLQRLHQLNHELFPNDKEPDIQLMDRIDTIVKEVVLRKQPHQPGNS
jgi:hypothetical protein